MKKIKLKTYSNYIIPLKSRAKDFLRLAPTRSKKETKKYKIKSEETSKSTSWTTEGFSISVGETRFPDEHFHIGFIATKKGTSKFAVKRNKAKRILRSLVNENLNRDNPELKNYDFTFVAKSKIFELERSKLEKDFKWAMEKILKKFKEENENIK